MPPKGKQIGVQEGSLLQLLRSAGFQTDLPPSTVQWLDNAPVFKFLSSKLSQDNFVAPADQQEYTEIMMAKGPNADLYDALGSGSDDEADEEQLQDQQGKDEQWMGAVSDADVQRQVQAKEQYVQHLEQQIASLKAVSGQLDAATRKQRSRQPLYISLQAQANHELACAKAELAQLNAELNSLLQGLREVCSSLASLAQERPEQWLLCAADLGSYAEQDEAARQLFNRAMQLLSAAGVVRQLDPTATASAAAADSQIGSPAWQQQQQQLQAGMSPRNAAAAGAAQAAFPSALIHTPARQQTGKQQQQQSLLTPRARGKSNRAEALLGADIKRHADQEARNAALLRELTRQRLSFKLALDEMLRSEVKEAGFKGRLAAAEDVKATAGGFARLKKMGPPGPGVAQLLHEVSQLEEARQLLGGQQLLALTEDLARLNDTYIVAGDYDRQLHKMALAAQRKQAVLLKLLDVTSRHLLLLLLGGQEWSRLGGLSQELATAHTQLEGHVQRVRARVNRCAAGAHALQQAQQRSNLQAEDSYLLAFAAAADGSLAMQPAAAEDSSSAAVAAAEPGTPLSGLAAALASTPRSAHTPSYMPSKHLTDQLQHLSSSTQQRSSQLQQLLQELPQQLDRHLATAQQLHLLAFPPGQTCAPLVPAAPGHHHGHIGSSSTGGWDGASSAGTASAAPSIRSMRSASSSAASSGGGHGHPLPLLRVPEVAEAQQQLEACCQGLGRDMHRLVLKQNEYAVVMNQQRGELELERSVMRLFFTKPQELAEHVARLKGEVEALETARELAVRQE
ncbi:hypothetical protein OEZ85_009343 [Tetradesmus obliquus]|uniref:HAUS augmin-like complex subunit 3 N-terminal domain-containing protein n=1 Tax=Tetradesmus obliquus TaxID=3088 RepID=A0ABY8UBU2_TETOB|nr:hypothetical protein OEZ85_009343 [Tetradesmus obliquus]